MSVEALKPKEGRFVVDFQKPIRCMDYEENVLLRKNVESSVCMVHDVQSPYHWLVIILIHSIGSMLLVLIIILIALIQQSYVALGLADAK